MLSPSAAPLGPPLALPGRVAWVAFPSLRIVRSEQQYECLAVGQYRFRSGTFSAHLVVDADGLVHDYEGAWRAIAQG